MQPDLSNEIHKAIFRRGVFLHRYSGVEHTINELLLRAGGDDSYRDFGDPPYAWSKRIQRLARIIDADGPLRKYADEIRAVITPLTSIERHRHIIVHGMMSLNPLGDRSETLLFRAHDWIDGGLGEVTMWITTDELIEMTQSMGEFTQKLTTLVLRIFQETGLETDQR